MIRIVTPEEMQRWDKSRIASGIPAKELMRRAAIGLFDAVCRMRHEDETVTVFCGSGNNGGDGYALAWLLACAQIPVRIVSRSNPDRMTDEAAYYRTLCIEHDIPIAADWEPLPRELLADALFGVGLSRPIEGWYADLIRRINASGKSILSADIPSGLDANNGTVQGIAVFASETVAMQFPKVGMLLGQGRAYCGTITVCKLDKDLPFTFSDELFWQQADDITPLLPPRPFDSHKGTNGHALLCVGSSQYIGAALLSSKACLRSGCGILSVVTPSPVRPAFATLPEAITIATGTNSWNEDACKIAIRALSGKQAIGIGCGIGSDDILPLLEASLKSGIPTVLDADGLNCLSRHRDRYDLLHENVVITPHPGEMARLLNCTAKQVLSDPIAAARSFPCTVLLKGATTVVTNGTTTVLCTEGTPGLSKGGSGDVLCGIITALLAQGLKPFDAARAGTFLLGTSAKKAYELLGQRMLLASDVTEAFTGEISH